MLIVQVRVTVQRAGSLEPMAATLTRGSAGFWRLVDLAAVLREESLAACRRAQEADQRLAEEEARGVRMAARLKTSETMVCIAHNLDHRLRNYIS